MNYGKASGNECNVSYVILHAPDLRYGRQIDVHNYTKYSAIYIAPRARLRLVWGSLTLAQLTQLKFVNTVGINIYCEVCKNWLLQKYLVPNQLLRGQDLLSCPEVHILHFTLF